MLRENDTDGRMDVLMVTALRSRALLPNDHGVWCQHLRARCPAYDREDEMHSGLKVTHLETPLISTLVVLLGECAYKNSPVSHSTGLTHNFRTRGLLFACCTGRTVKVAGLSGTRSTTFSHPRLRRVKLHRPGFPGHRHHDFPDRYFPLLPHVSHSNVAAPMYHDGSHAHFHASSGIDQDARSHHADLQRR